MSSYTKCPCCNAARPAKASKLGLEIFECKKCNAVYGDCYLGDSYAIVRPYMTSRNVPAEETRYYDFMALGSKGLERRHGWYEPATKLIVQVG